MLTRNGSRRARRALRVKNFFHFFLKKIPLLSKGIFTNSITSDTQITAHRLKQPLSSQTADAFTVVDSIAIGTA